MHYISDDDTKDGDQTYVRFGFKGETQINDQLTGYGRWEAEFAGNKAESDSTQKTRLAFAGLKLKDIGSLDYGRNLGALYDVEAWTDMFPEFGGDSSAQTDNFMTKRASGLATYRNTDFFGAVDGLDMTLQYQGKNENRDVKKQNGDGFGTSLTYDFGGSDFAVSGAYTNSDRTNAQNLLTRGEGKKAEAWATGLKYDANDIYLAAMYSETRNMTPISGGFANKAQNFEVVAQYQFDFGLRPSLGYVQSKGKDIEGVGDEDLVKYIDVGATYYFNKNMSAFVDYKINQIDGDNKLGVSSDDIVALGMTYQSDIVEIKIPAQMPGFFLPGGVGFTALTPSLAKREGEISRLRRQLNRFAGKVIRGFKLQIQGGQQCSCLFEVLFQSMLQAVDHFLVFDWGCLPVAVFIKQAELVAIRKTFFFRFHFHPPAPEFTFFGCRLHVDAYSQAVEKKRFSSHCSSRIYGPRAINFLISLLFGCPLGNVIAISFCEATVLPNQQNLAIY